MRIADATSLVARLGQLEARKKAIGGQHGGSTFLSAAASYDGAINGTCRV